MVCIKNLRFERVKEVYDVRVDRSSVLGNKFYMVNESMRDEVCDKYEIYFYNMLNESVNFRKELYRILDLYKRYGKVNLFCWCAPKRCHAETIKKWLECEIKKGF